MLKSELYTYATDVILNFMDFIDVSLAMIATDMRIMADLPDVRLHP